MPSMRSRRPPGQGTVEELPSGSYRVKLRVNGKRVTLGPYATREEADRVRVGAVAEVHAAGVAPTGALTLRQWGARWFKGHAKTRANDKRRAIWDDHIVTSPFIDWPIRDLTRKAVKAWRDELVVRQAVHATGRGEASGHRLAGRTLATGTVNRILSVLSASLRDAIEAEVLTTNPVMNLRVREALRADEEWTFLTTEEIALVMAVRPEGASPRTGVPEWARLLYTVLIHTGLRKGEAWGLRWSDVTLEGLRPEIRVRRSFDGPVKTRSSRRDIPLLEPARLALVRWRDLAWASPEGLVWPTRKGKMRGFTNDGGWSTWRRSSTSRLIYKGHREKAGITRHVRFHDLRHTCASHLLMGTWGRAWALHEVQRFLGHSSTKETERYAHLAPGYLHDAAAATRGPNGAGGSGGPEGPSGGPRGGQVVDLKGVIGALDLPGPKIESASNLLKSLGSVVDHGPAVDHARGLLGRIAAGEGVTEESLTDLALSVLAGEPVRMALAILEGGPHATRRAIELASMLLAPPAPLTSGARGPHTERAISMQEDHHGDPHQQPARPA